MEIDRNNYEEYFLLYADNELPDAEKIEVLKFIRENKDLEAEFKLILNTICKPDEGITLGEKENLFRESEKTFISDKNFEEIFVLYHDEELNEEEKSRTELFVSRHPQLKKEFDVTGIARLTPDTSIIFPHKRGLYRRQKSLKVIPVFWRTIAAAVLIGFGVWLFYDYSWQENTLPIVVENSNGIPKISPDSRKEIPSMEPAADNVAGANGQKNDFPQGSQPGAPKKSQSLNIEKDALPAIAASGIKNKSIYYDNTTDIVIEKIDPDVVISVNKNIINSPQQDSDEIVSHVGLQQDSQQDPIEKEIDDSAQTQMVFLASADEKNENYVFYNVTTEEFRKSKVGGFLKKMKRMVERNNPISRIFSGDDKQVASNAYTQ